MWKHFDDVARVQGVVCKVQASESTSLRNLGTNVREQKVRPIHFQCKGSKLNEFFEANLFNADAGLFPDHISLVLDANTFQWFFIGS